MILRMAVYLYDLDVTEEAACMFWRVDFNDAPELKDWAIKAGNYALKVYPDIIKALASEGYTPTREFRITVKSVPKGPPAYASGGGITCNADYVKGHLDDMGMVAHELSHVIQRYRGRNPGWLVEGVADYVRYYVIEPGAKNARFNVERSKYNGAYQATAGFLNYVEKKNGPGIVARLNREMREGKFKEANFAEIIGGDPEVLWNEMKESMKKPAAPAKPAGEK